MHRHRTLWFTICLLILTSLACNAFAGEVESGLLPQPTPAENEIATAAVDDPIEIAPTVTLAGEASSSQAQITVLVDLNVRSGPGVQYDRVGFLLKDTSAQIIGKDPLTGWWKIVCPSNADGSQCWVSGGAQYVVAENTQEVAEAEVPPTPTVPPPELDPNVGLIVFLDNGRLLSALLDLTTNPPTAKEPIQISERTDVQEIFISPNGTRVAFKAGSHKANGLYTVNSDGSDPRLLIASDTLPIVSEGDTTDLVVTLDQIAWRPDGFGLLFNTNIIDLAGPGTGSQSDLWQIGLDGNLTELYKAGTGGGAFAISPTGQLLLGRADSLALGDLSGSAPTNFLTFEIVNTASEYVYYPQPQWNADGSAGYTAVPNREQFSPDAKAALWRINSAGELQQLNDIPGSVLSGGPMLWSGDSNHLGYVRKNVLDPNSKSELFITNGDGSGFTSYASGESELLFFGWNATSSAFLYAADGYYAPGRLGESFGQINLPAGQRVGDAQWLTESYFVTAVGAPDSGLWAINSNNLEGSSLPLVTLTGGFSPIFEVWAP